MGNIFTQQNIMLIIATSALVYLLSRQSCQGPVSYEMYFTIIGWALVSQLLVTFAPSLASLVIFAVPVFLSGYMLYERMDVNQYVKFLDDKLLSIYSRK